jgi:hypothetical protein
MPYGSTGWRPFISKPYDLPEDRNINRIRKRAAFFIVKHTRKKI